MDNAVSVGAPRRFGLVKKVLLGLALLVAVLVGFIAMQPSEFVIERSLSIEAAPEEVFAFVNDFHKWNDWSPWAKLDPKAQNSFEGPDSGEGAIFRWAGNSEVGEGSMTLVQSQPYDAIRIRLEFIKPFADTSDVQFSFRPEGDQTAVTWTMNGRHNFISKAMCLVMDMDKMVGGQFEQGLENLKSAVLQARTPGA